MNDKLFKNIGGNTFKLITEDVLRYLGTLKYDPTEGTPQEIADVVSKAFNEIKQNGVSLQWRGKNIKVAPFGPPRAQDTYYEMPYTFFILDNVPNFDVENAYNTGPYKTEEGGLILYEEDGTYHLLYKGQAAQLNSPDAAQKIFQMFRDLITRKDPNFSPQSISK